MSGFVFVGGGTGSTFFEGAFMTGAFAAGLTAAIIASAEFGFFCAIDAEDELLEEDALFLVATVYAVRLSFLALDNGLAAALGNRLGQREAGEMAIPEQGSNRLLPTAIFARWSNQT